MRHSLSNYLYHILVAALTLSAAAVMGYPMGNYFGGLDPTADPVSFSSDIGQDVSLHHPNWHYPASGVDAMYVVYNASNLADSLLTGATDYTTDFSDFPDGAYCGAGTGLLSGKTRSPHTPAAVDTSATSCGMLYNKAYAYENGQYWRMCYDTSMVLVEQCPNDPNAVLAFSMMTSSMQRLGNTSALRQAYWDWLKSVLYLNTTDPQYFCSCLRAMGNTVPIPPDTGWGNVSRATNYPLAIMQWIMMNTDCDKPRQPLWKSYEAARETQREQWQNDTSLYALDTTLPTMQQLGIDTLLAKHFKYAHVEGKPFPSIVPEYALSRNPFENATTLRFTLTEASYERVDVLDVLGREVWSEGDGHLLDPGEHTIPIDMSTAPSGTYYLRITLGTGEVRTIKMVKEGAGH